MKRIEHRNEKFEFSFVEYIPENASGELPLIVQLHGAGERGDDLSLVDVHGFSKVLAKEDINARFIMPQCPKNTFWAARVESLGSFIKKLMEYFPTDKSRVYLTGLSMGGFGTWYTAMAYPELFAAIAPVCGGGMAWNACVLRMPIKIFHGTADPIVNVFYSDDMARALGKRADVIYERLDGVGHNAWDTAYTKDLANWLLSNSLLSL